MRLRRFSGGVGLSVSIGFLAGRFVPVFFLRGIERGRLRVCRSSRRAADGWPGAHARRRQCRCRRPIRARSVAAWGVATSAGAVPLSAAYPGAIRGRLGRRHVRRGTRTGPTLGAFLGPSAARPSAFDLSRARTVPTDRRGSVADGGRCRIDRRGRCRRRGRCAFAGRISGHVADGYGAAVGGLSGRDPWPPGASPRPQGHTDGADARRDPGAVRCAFFCCNALMACRIFGAFWGRLARLARCGPKC